MKTSRPSPIPFLAGLPLLLSLLGGCQLVGATTWNLDQLHEPDGRHRRKAELESHLGFLLRHSFGKLGGQFGGREPGDAEGEGGSRDDPGAAQRPLDASGGDDGGGERGRGMGGAKPLAAAERACFVALVDLAAYDSAEPRTAATQVSWFARLAVEDPWTLCRERSVLELGAHGQRLGLTMLELDGLPEGVAASAAPDVANALAEVLEAARGARARGENGDLERGELEGACARLVALPLDLAGARRLLRGVSFLIGSEALHGESHGLLVDVSRHLQRICVARALVLAFLDPAGRVRAAALDASAVAVGPAILGNLMRQVRFFPEEVERTRLYGLVAEHGLDAALALATEERGVDRAELLREQLLFLAREASNPRNSSRTRNAALVALGRLAPEGPGGLRYEEWVDWLSGGDRGQAAAGAGAGGGAGVAAPEG